MAKRADGLRLLALFNSLWEEHYDKSYVGNRYSDQWGFADMLEDLGYDTAKQVINYYFKLSIKQHPRKWLLYHYHELAKQMEEVEIERSFREQVKEQTKLRRLNES